MASAKTQKEEKNIVKLLKEFNLEELSPRLFIYGKENLLKKQFVDKIKEHTKNDFHFVWGDDINLKLLDEIFASSSLFSAGDTVVIWNVDAFISNLNQQEKKDFIKLVEKISSPNRLVLVSMKEKLLVKEPYKSITSLSEIIHSPNLTPKAFAVSIKKKIEREGKQINDETLKYLVSKLKNDLYYAKQEIEKLLIYTNEKDQITKEDIDAVVIPKIEENVFAFVDRFFTKDKNALKIYMDLIETSHHPFEIQSLILTQANKILTYKTMLKQGKNEHQIFSEMKVNHPAQKATIKKLAKFTTENELIDLIKEMYELEQKQKIFYEDINETSINFIAKRVI